MGDRTASPARAAAVTRAMVRKELREVARDGRFWAAALTVAGLLVVALAFGLRQARSVHAERTAAQASAEEHWRGQDDKNPHVAAHYGTHVFKPAGPLSFVDPGIDPFVGASVKLEAHRRNDLEGARAADATGLARFGGLSVASVLQLLVPLLTIALGFSAWTAERERGTLRQLASLGVAPSALVAGKSLGVAAALLLLLLPALVLGAAATALLGAATGPTSAARAIALGVSYVVYFGVFVGLTLAVSAKASSSRAAIIALLGLWVISAIVAPRAASDAAAWVAPTPSHAAVADAVRDSLRDGLPGGPPREDRIGVITEELLEKEGFQGAELLMEPALLSAIELQAEARFENEVIDHHHARLADAIERRERLSQLASVVSPVVAIRSLSMALAGTDYAHHRHFSDGAERHRRSLVDMLNRELGEKGGGDAWAYRAGRELWERAPPFEPTRPDLAWVLARQRASVLSLGAWLLLAGALAWLAARRIRIV